VPQPATTAKLVQVFIISRHSMQIGHSVRHSVNQSANQSVNQSVNQSINWPIGRSIGRRRRSSVVVCSWKRLLRSSDVCSGDSLQRRQSGSKSGGVVNPGQNNFDLKFPIFSGNFTKNRFFRANLRKISIFSGNFTKNFDFSRQLS